MKENQLLHLKFRIMVSCHKVTELTTGTSKEHTPDSKYICG